MDAAGQRRGGGLAERELRARARWRRALRARRGPRRGGARRGRGGPRALQRRRAGRSATAPTRDRSSTPAQAGRLSDPRRRLRHDRGRHGHRAPRAGVRRRRLPGHGRGGDLPGRRARTPSSTRCGRTAPTTSACAITTGTSYEGRFVKDPELTAELIEDLRARGLLLRVQDYEHSYPHCWRSRHAADLLRQTVLVHRHLEAARRAAGGERDGQLAPATRQGGPLRGLAEEQRRLGALARALLGHAAAGVALRARARARDRLLRRAAAALGQRARGPSPAVRRRGRVPLSARRRRWRVRRRALRAADAPRAGGDRRVVRLRRDAVRPAPLPVRERGHLRAALPGRLHLRGPGPDARLVLLAAGGRDAAGPGGPFDHRRRTGTSSASA